MGIIIGITNAALCTVSALNFLNFIYSPLKFIYMPSFKKVKQNAWKIYNLLRREKLFCPALDDYVYFTLKGWNHRVGQFNYKKRNLNDAYRRLQLVKFAKQIIIGSDNFIVKIAYSHGYIFYAVEGNIKMEKENNNSKVRIIF